MTQYISKSALVSGIKRKRDAYINLFLADEVHALNDILEFIDTLKVKEEKESTASDRGMAEEIIFQLKRVEQDYYIDLTREMEWLRNIVKKGG